MSFARKIARRVARALSKARPPRRPPLAGPLTPSQGVGFAPSQTSRFTVDGEPGDHVYRIVDINGRPWRVADAARE